MTFLDAYKNQQLRSNGGLPFEVLLYKYKINRKGNNMTTSASFSTFLDNIKVDNYEKIGNRYEEITKKLNKAFRDTDSETANSLRVGSYGRYTGIKGISDLDMLYIMPKSKWDIYKGAPKQLLADVRDALRERYPNTDIRYDRLVVDVFFSDFTFEVQPVFEEDGDDGYINYKYPDTKYGCYKITKPKQEQEAMTDFKNHHGKHHRLLCKMTRSWKNNMGVAMGGLLVDTLAYNFLKERDDYDFASYSDFDDMCKDFFEFLKSQPKQDHYQALGSNQDVKVKHPFRNKAGKAYQKANEAIGEETEDKRNEAWREIFGRDFPKSEEEECSEAKCFTQIYSDNEQFIEDKYPVDILFDLKIDCIIERNGFRPTSLRDLLVRKEWIPHDYTLKFYIKDTDVEGDYLVKWKVKNIGEEAKRRNCLRGFIENPNMNNNGRKETSNFYGPHYVECYVIKNGVVVARDKILVPIKH